MEPTFLGMVSAPVAGTPVRILSDPTVRACRIVFATIPGLTGNIYLGGVNMNTSTYTGVLIKLNPPSTVGLTDSLTLDAEGASNSLTLADYWLAASVAGEGLLVTYFQV